MIHAIPERSSPREDKSYFRSFNEQLRAKNKQECHKDPDAITDCHWQD